MTRSTRNRLAGWVLGCLLVLALQLVPAQAQPFIFSQVHPELTALDYGAMAFADLDGDGDLDLVGAGNASRREPYAPITFVAWSKSEGASYGGVVARRFDVTTLPIGLWHSSVDWLDYDLDGKLDIMVTGTPNTAAAFEDRSHTGNARLYRNTGGGAFTEVDSGVDGVYGGAIAIGDYDNDGDEDMLLLGLAEPGVHVTRLYRNDNGSFVEQEASFPQLAYGDAQWVDVDADGDLDLSLAGVTAEGSFVTELYRNGGLAGFAKMQVDLPGYAFSALDWGDIDNDGDLDLVLSGAVLSLTDFLSPEIGIYVNANGRFTQLRADLRPVFYGGVSWGDYDNDGDLDLFVIGGSDVTSGRVGTAYENDNGSFTGRLKVPGVSTSAFVLGDYDNDDDLDILATGSNSTLAPLVRIYRNNGTKTNAPPSPPDDLSSSVQGATVQLAWSRGADDRTPAMGLTYNLRVGTAPGLEDVVSAAADSETGRRWTPGRGNRDSAVQTRLEGLARGEYYWTVQSVDHSFIGSAFADEGTFNITAGKDFVTGVEDVQPVEGALHPGFPNPFSERTTLRYAVPETGPVTLIVYNILGARVRRLIDGVQSAGLHQVSWEGRDDTGRTLGPGVYFVRMQARGAVRVQRLTVVR